MKKNPKAATTKPRPALAILFELAAPVTWANVGTGLLDDVVLPPELPVVVVASVVAAPDVLEVVL